jgi:hypothetical protein
VRDPFATRARFFAKNCTARWTRAMMSASRLDHLNRSHAAENLEFVR